MKTLHRILLTSAITLSFAHQGYAQAATATATMPVSATVLAACLVVALPLAFGNYTGAQNDAQSTITVTCTPGTTYNVRLDAGTATGATVTSRAMTFNTTNTLGYAIYRNAGRTQNWGQTDNTDTVQGTGSGLPQLLPVYGRIPANEFAANGLYADQIGVTVAY
jgi:spore coat protein U-like protein